jgi:hypothetical protein
MSIREGVLRARVKEQCFREAIIGVPLAKQSMQRNFAWFHVSMKIPTEETYSIHMNDSDEMGEDPDVSNRPELDVDEFGSDRFIFRIKLWRALGYDSKHLIHDGLDHMLRTNKEIEIVGWPVIDSNTFCDPAAHSAPAENYQKSMHQPSPISCPQASPNF